MAAETNKMYKIYKNKILQTKVRQNQFIMKNKKPGIMKQKGQNKPISQGKENQKPCITCQQKRQNKPNSPQKLKIKHCKPNEEKQITFITKN